MPRFNTPAEVIAHLFTHQNPATGSMPPPQTAWVIYENGTAFFSRPTADLPTEASLDDITDRANQRMDALGPVRVGTSAADFSVTHLLDWFPRGDVYFVTFGTPDIATVVFVESDNDLLPGLLARRHREQDQAERRIIEVRGFGGVSC